MCKLIHKNNQTPLVLHKATCSIYRARSIYWRGEVLQVLSRSQSEAIFLATWKMKEHLNSKKFVLKTWLQFYFLPPPHTHMNPCIRRCHPSARKTASQAVVLFLRSIGRMQLTLHATRTTPLGAFAASCKQCLPGRGKPGVLRLGIGGVRGSMVIRLWPCMA